MRLARPQWAEWKVRAEETARQGLGFCSLNDPLCFKYLWVCLITNVLTLCIASSPFLLCHVPCIFLSSLKICGKHFVSEMKVIPLVSHQIRFSLSTDWIFTLGLAIYWKGHLWICLHFEFRFINSRPALWTPNKFLPCWKIPLLVHLLKISLGQSSWPCFSLLDLILHSQMSAVCCQPWKISCRKTSASFTF